MAMREATRNYNQSSHQIERDRLVHQHLGLVRHVLSRIVTELPETVDRENLRGAGLLGLVEAAARFDPERGVEFRQFAYRRIRGAVVDELRRNCPLPQSMFELWSQVRDVIASHNRPLSTSDIAAHLCIDEALVDECLEAARLLRPDEWQETLIPRQWTEATTSEAELIDNRRQLAEAIVQLPDRLREIITLYYSEQLRLKEIGCLLNLSESRISRLLSQAHLALRTILNQMQTAGHSRP